MYIYLAGPMSIGSEFQNYRSAIDVADRIFKRGHRVFVPHLSFFWNLIYRNDYERWLEYDFAWIDKCDAVVRIPGESNGADREVEYAKQKGIKVFFGLEEFMNSQYWSF